MKKLTREEIAAHLSEPNGSVQLAQMNVDQDSLFENALAMFREEGAASALLIRLAAKKQYLIRLSEDEEFIKDARAALESGSAKLRRNAARLIGLVRDEGSADALIAALGSEEQRFVRPSLILALGSTGGEKAGEFLKNYKVAPPADETEQKHYNEETEALVTALRSFAPRTEHEFTGLGCERTIELRSADQLTHQLAEELEDFGVESFDHRRSSLKVTTSDYPALFEARCFSEALFPVGSCEATPSLIARKAAPFIEKLMREAHSGEPPYRFRVENALSLPESVSRPQLTRAVSAALENASLVNAPSDYEAELRMEGSLGSARLYVKLFTFADTRFSYREGSIPASMAPSTAASVLRFASEYLSVNARVIDPCCGSGTFLIERGLLSPCASLTGVDIAHKAIDIARRNTYLAGVNAKYTVNDILRFECHRPYDELIANLPFGNRVGDHSSCEKLYSGLLAKLPKLVKKGGVAILYTMEFTLLKRLLRGHADHLTLLSQARTEAGGLTPMIFIIRVD